MHNEVLGNIGVRVAILVSALGQNLFDVRA